MGVVGPAVGFGVVGPGVGPKLVGEALVDGLAVGPADVGLVLRLGATVVVTVVVGACVVGRVLGVAVGSEVDGC